MLSIQDTMKSFINCLKGEEGGAFSRFKSWEYCHKAFVDAHKRKKKGEKIGDKCIDNLALHLAFYLASWGMYRASSFLLQRDYKTHMPVVRIVLEDKYNELWNFDPSDANDEKIKRIAGLVCDVCNVIDKSGYCKDGEGIKEKTVIETSKEDKTKTGENLTVTLKTKIMMGTFGVVPAFDRFFTDGLRRYRKKDNSIKGAGFNSKRLVEVFLFAKNKKNELMVANEEAKLSYPVMKLVDMYFWEVGYEAGFIKQLEAISKYLQENNLQMIEDGKKKKHSLRIFNQIISFAPEVKEKEEGKYYKKEKIDKTIEVIKKRVEPNANC